ncbi:substrate-binding domain-containing protein [Paenibacillus xylaniclasticus]|uniref:substrate-binding domain-containing protein n=1 Tax=Paenibacillus xylaniclasticus TaxID=588083 RepID=UPI000FDA3C12|nr:substrate-binding domain-containing protein [Paenibacillus xylaniclasticus]
MKKLSMQVILNLIQALLVIVPVVVVLSMMLTGAWETSSKMETALSVTAALSVVAIVLSNVVISGFKRKINILKENLAHVENGDLTVVPDTHSVKEVSQLSEAFGKIIQEFQDVVSNFHSSTSEVKHMIETVVETSNESARNAKDILKSADAVATGAVRQAEDAEASHELSSDMVDKIEAVSDSTGLMLSKAEAVRSMTDFGKESVTALLDSSKISENNIMEINESIKELSEMASNITNVTAIITEIAGQTSLLSLNASIEAARAGEAGKGFAVVAGEIKKLAERSLSSARSIVSTINGVQEKVQITSDKIQNTTQAIVRQMEAVQQTREAFNDISDATYEMFSQLKAVRDGIKQLDSHKTNIAQSIENISVIAAETAASSQEITSMMYTQNNSAEVMVELSHNLDQLVTALDDRLMKYTFSKLEKKKKTFAVITVLDIPFFEDTFKGAEEVGKKLGINIIRIAPERWGPDVQSGYIYECIEKGVDGIAIAPIKLPIVTDAIKEAVSKGIKVVTFDIEEIPDMGISSFVGTENFPAGVMLGEAAVKCLKGRGKIIISIVSDMFENMKERINGFKKAIEPYKDIQIVGMESNQETIDQRVSLLQGMLTEHPDVDCIVYMDYQGAETMMKLTKQTEVRAKIIGFDKTDEAMQMLKDGVLQSIIVQRPKVWGELCIKLLSDLTQGKPVPSFMDGGTFEINRRNMSMYL